MSENWLFKVTHTSGLMASGERFMDGPGIGQVAIVRDLECSCGYRHTLIGTESMEHKKHVMSGKGHNSVSNPNDSVAKDPPEVEEIPSWEGGPVGP